MLVVLLLLLFFCFFTAAVKTPHRYEAMIFSLAFDGQHADDAYQVESMLAIQLDVGSALGSALSLARSAGPWAVIRGQA